MRTRGLRRQLLTAEAILGNVPVLVRLVDGSEVLLKTVGIRGGKHPAVILRLTENNEAKHETR